MLAYQKMGLMGVLVGVLSLSLAGQQKKDPEKRDRLRAGTFSGLRLRSLGPALTSGRVADIAVHPGRRSTYYVAVASGGVWKTSNSGTTWEPIFDQQASYSIGCLAIDPNDPFVIWVGTGENNSQRSVSYGDGVYKSIDGGKTWTHMGLKASEHIGKILIDPRDSKRVFVAAQGPLWSSGGERGLYRSSDGGKSWEKILEISDDTGVGDVVMDPSNPDVLLAAAYQRRRHVWTLINGGPESALYKSTDGGDTWRKIERGLPQEDLGRIGLAFSPVDSSVVYAIVEAADGAGGFFRSQDRGESWEKRSSYLSSSPQYYQEIVPHPRQVDQVYSLDTWLMVTHDGGKTFSRVGERYKHVDNHALWIDPQDPDYFLAGCDGGVYESFDAGATWHFKANLPVTQFYRISVDNAFPFYNVFGGTQDNFSLAGPSRTTSAHGITNADWLVTQGGDGFETQVDPENPDIIYAQSQYGGLVRFDRRSGERISIQPQPAPDEEPLRWNWDSPLLISPHSPRRLYFAANRLFRSDDRGDSWKAISADLTRRVNRNELEVMGRVWSIDAVAKNDSTSFFGNIVSLAESPLQEGLLYVGTDDGLIQVSEDGGSSWRRLETFPGVPERTYVSFLLASSHQVDTLYAAFDNHKNGDFQPYLLRSRDRGRSWESVAGDLPERGSVYALAEDPQKPELLFVGTEFGLFFTLDGGKRWVALKSGLPTIAVRDLEIQKRESDLVVGTFGRGIYILDDYSPLRHLTPEALEEEALLFPVKDAWMFIPSTPLGVRGKGFQGDSFYSAPNPPVGAVITYYLRDELKTRQKQRKEAERKLQQEGAKRIPYPSWEQLREEEREEAPAVVVIIRDSSGEVVRRLNGPTRAGIHRISWDFRYPPSTLVQLRSRDDDDNPFSGREMGPLAVPGSYEVSLAKRVDGEWVPLGEPRRFEARPLGTATLPAQDREALLAFQKETARLQRAVLGAAAWSREARNRLLHIRKALAETPSVPAELDEVARSLQNRLQDLLLELVGDSLKRRHNEPTLPSIQQRVQGVVFGHWNSTSAPTRTHREAFQHAAAQFEPLLGALHQLERELQDLEDRLEELEVPWTPGRLPRWER